MQMLLPFQGVNPNIHSPRALPWAGCLLAFQAVTSQKLYRTAIIFYVPTVSKRHNHTTRKHLDFSAFQQPLTKSNLGRFLSIFRRRI